MRYYIVIKTTVAELVAQLVAHKSAAFVCRREQQSHNLEVPGSSPGWSTNEIGHLQTIVDA